MRVYIFVSRRVFCSFGELYVLKIQVRKYYFQRKYIEISRGWRIRLQIARVGAIGLFSDQRVHYRPFILTGVGATEGEEARRAKL